MLVVFLVSGCRKIPGESSKNISLFQKIKSTHVLRCGYVEWPKLIERDPVSNKLVGIFPDYMEALGRSLGFTIEWGPETSFQDMVEAIATTKVDAICSGIWASGVRALHVTFTEPVAYSPVFAFVRAAETRFDEDLSQATSPNVTIATTDGEISAIIKERRFPQANAHALPKLSEGQQLLYAVATSKADLTFSDLSTVEPFSKSFPGKLKIALHGAAIAAFGMTIVLPKGEYELKELFDVATRELQQSGEIDAILNKYQTSPNEFLRVAKPFTDVRGK